MSDRVMQGSTQWAFAAGHIPVRSTGHEPEFTSRDELCLLNTTGEEACARVTVYHSGQDPVGPYEISVGAQRVKQVRINDLIDPQAVPLGVAYGLTLQSDVPLIVHMKHVDTSQAELGVTISTGIHGET